MTDLDMLDEWGREFLAEGRRRTDMIRWGVFNTGAWWDKQPDDPAGMLQKPYRNIRAQGIKQGHMVYELALTYHRGCTGL